MEAEQLKYEVENVTKSEFEALALRIFQYQYKTCETYKQYINNLNVNIDGIISLDKIPFLPINFFKTQQVLSNQKTIETIFESSGTTGQNTSRHFVVDTCFYKKHSLQLFEKIYGKISDFHILAVLPSYLDKGNSSLVYMINNFIENSGSSYSGFFNNDYEKVINVFENIKKNNTQNKRKILLWGVTYALLDLIDVGFDFSDFKNQLIIMETGGMKGRRPEMIREELYKILKKGFEVTTIHSEYGMTELLSQAYSTENAVFQCANSMKIILREINDPFSTIAQNNFKKTGGINVIDLANIDSCCFIETQDLGQYVDNEGRFKVLGRFDNSDIRGCNLLIN